MTDPRENITHANPATESCLLIEESQNASAQNTRPNRVLGIFELFLNGEPARITDLMLAQQDFTGIKAIGIVATMKEPQGLHAQCGWFYLDSIDWYWARIERVQELRVCHDKRFRGGAPHVLLRSEFADYIMLDPNPAYECYWRPTLITLGAPACVMWPMGGARPSWWPDFWVRWWPSEQPPTTSKRRASCDADELRALTQDLSVGPTQSGHGQETYQTANVLLTRIDHMEPWELKPDSGFQPTTDAGKQEAVQVTQDGKSSGRQGKRARR